MIEEKEIDLNINDISRMKQQIEKNKTEMIGYFTLSIFVFIFAIIFNDAKTLSSWSLLISLGLSFYGLFLYMNAKAMETDLSQVAENKKENNIMKKIEFKSAEEEIDGLVLSKEIEYKPVLRDKKNPNDHKLILDHTNQNLYYIVLDQTDKKESIKYRKVPYSEIVQAAVIIDEVIISKSSLASKMGGTVAGGILGGGVGAIVGGTNTKKSSSKEINEIELRIVVNDVKTPSISMRLNTLPIKKEAKIKEVQNLADEWKTTVDLIIRENNKTLANPSTAENKMMDSNPISKQNEKIQMLKDLAELKASGSISEEDFNELKRDVLDN